jgi:protein-S-isoprenylcysteine O-methyltransferase Ste14
MRVVRWLAVPVLVLGLLSLLGSLAFPAVVGLLLFGCAGRWDLPLFWAYLGVWAAGLLATAWVADPTLARERLRPGPGGKDYTTLVVITPLWLGQHALAGLDVGRFHWSDHVPLAVQILGLLAVAAALAVLAWAVAVNRFFSSVIRIQADRGHHLVTTGPYRYVRHPAYACAPLLLVGSGLALGSWLAALGGLLMVLPILRRTAQEDRTLREHLEGYAAYAQRVRYRLFPGIW